MAITGQERLHVDLGGNATPVSINDLATFVKNGLPPPPPPVVSNATTSARGVVLQAANTAASTATDVAGLVADFNNFLIRYKAAGQG